MVSISWNLLFINYNQDNKPIDFLYKLNLDSSLLRKDKA